jgi:peptidoglycan/xylan/chitin deacetylase (PgdA/CDA1 family)
VLLIDVPPEAPAERDYALSVLFDDWLGIPYTVRVVEGLNETHVLLASDPDGVRIVLPDVLLARRTAFLSPASLPPAELPTVDLPEWAGTGGRLPLLFSTGSGTDDLVRRREDRFELRLDVLGSLLFMLTRYEEYVQVAGRDEHGRFPATASVLASSGWLRWPIVDMYVDMFAALLRLAWPGIELAPSGGQPLLVEHDVDHPSSSMRWHGLQRARIVAGDLLRRRDPGLAARRARSFLDPTAGISRFDPFNTYDFLMRASESAGIASTFFFLTRDTELPFGSRYRLDDGWVRPLMAEIADRGHHIGLHGSYPSWDDASRLAEEWAALEHACRGLPAGVLRRTIRQHFLRWQAGVTWRAQDAAGLAIDETLCFADSIGYRAGTARSFPAYDLGERRRLALRIQPLHVMDQTLLGYMALDPEEALAGVVELSRRTRRYGGSLSILWHNSTLVTGQVRAFYLRMLREVG